MKKNDWILIITTALYSYLFYQEKTGFNVLLLSLALIIALLIKDKQVVKNKSWIMAALGTIITACSVSYYGNYLSIIANVIALCVLSGISNHKNSSVFFSLFFACFTFITSPFYMIFDLIKRKSNQVATSPKRSILLFILPILICIIFLFIYKASNPVFDELTKKINLNFISITWIISTIFGFILMYSFYYQKRIKLLANIDDTTNTTLENKDHQPISFFGEKIALIDENFSGTLLFVLLNILLLIVNLIDLTFLFGGKKLPSEISYSNFVHQGTNSIIFSIFFAIVIILFCFRGALNFYEKNKTITYLTYGWILQNIFMLYSTAEKNNLYVTDFGLTYKRIGVYIYLILCVFGLVTTFIKIMNKKTNHFLFKSNGSLYFILLSLATIVNWDMIITKYNLTKAKHNEKEYLSTLSYSVLPTLLKLPTDSTIDSNVQHMKQRLFSDDYNYDNTYEQNLYKKVSMFLLDKSKRNWKSNYWESEKIYTQLLETGNPFKKLYFSNEDLDSIHFLKKEFLIEELYLDYNNLKNINQLKDFTTLKKLIVNNNELKTLSGIENLTNLEILHIQNNEITDFSPLYTLRYLKELKVNSLIDKDKIEELKKNIPSLNIIY
jgi:hypothetical protein